MKSVYPVIFTLITLNIHALPAKPSVRLSAQTLAQPTTHPTTAQPSTHPATQPSPQPTAQPSTQLTTQTSPQPQTSPQSTDQPSTQPSSPSLAARYPIIPWPTSLTPQDGDFLITSATTLKADTVFATKPRP
ncbi:MAG TPA: hypothetical protein VKQ52_14310 [Puia sp.]|nr:hypothetical protein [Puia sp.]